MPLQLQNAKIHLLLQRVSSWQGTDDCLMYQLSPRSHFHYYLELSSWQWSKIKKIWKINLHSLNVLKLYNSIFYKFRVESVFHKSYINNKSFSSIILVRILCCGDVSLLKSSADEPGYYAGFADTWSNLISTAWLIINWIVGKRLKNIGKYLNERGCHSRLSLCTVPPAPKTATR